MHCYCDNNIIIRAIAMYGKMMQRNMTVIMF